MKRFYLAALLALALVTSVFLHPLAGMVLFAAGLVAPFLPLWAIAAALGVLTLAAPAYAQAAAATATDAAGTFFSLPYGTWINNLGSLILEITPVAVLWLLRRLPASLYQIATTMQADQLLNKAISYAINAVEGATAGKTLSVNVGNAVLAQALNYVATHAPDWLINWLGGLDAIAQKIIARLNLDATASVSLINGTPTITGATTAAASPVPAAVSAS